MDTENCFANILIITDMNVLRATFGNVESASEWAAKTKTFIFLFLTDINDLPDLTNCDDIYMSHAMFVGNIVLKKGYVMEDAYKEMISQHLNNVEHLDYVEKVNSLDINEIVLV